MRTKHKSFVIGIVFVVLTMFFAAQLQAQEEGQELTWQEYMEKVMSLVLESQEIIKEIAEVAATKSEVQALETRIVALETAMPWPTVTPTVTPTPTPFPDEARGFAHQLAADDYDSSWGKFSDKREDEQTRILNVYQEYFVKTSEVCDLNFTDTYELLQKYAEPIDWFSPPHLEEKLRNMDMGGAGWRLEFISRIATNSFIQRLIYDDDDGCDGYLEWYTSN